MLRSVRAYCFVILFMLVLNVNKIQAQYNEIFTLGPMLHLNIGGEKIRPSFGLEFAYWNYNDFPYSMDFGFDIQKGAFRIYTEAQTGLGLAGLSAGPYWEIKKAAPDKIGLQASVWGNYFLGGDLRFRFAKGETIFAPGIYAKLPWFKDPEHHESSNSSWGDWD